MPEPLLKLENVNVDFHGRPVLQNINLSLNAGEIVTLIGPNGAGKTTMVRIVLGLLKPDSGQLSDDKGFTNRLYAAEAAD